MEAMLEKVREVVRRYRMFAPGERVLVAVSGGADSMALLHVLGGLREGWGLGLTVAHLDHGIRPDGAEDLALVRAAAERLGLPFLHENADVPARARAEGRNVEEAARRVRREFLERAARGVGATKIALGHTRTDVAETVVLHLLRGAGPRGLRGILPVAPPYVRPLLLVSREETRAFCRAEGIPFRDDPTNEDRRLARNAVRLEVLPVLSRLNPRAEEALARAGGLLAEAEEVLTWVAGLARAEVEGPQGLELEPLRRLPRAVQGLVVHRAAEEAGVVLERGHVEAVLGLVERGHGEVHLPRGLVARAGSGVLKLLPRSPLCAPPQAWTLPPEGGVEIADLGWAFCVRRVPRPEDLKSSSRWVAFLDPCRLDPPLVVRAPVPGDRMRPLGMAGTKKVSDLLMEARVPRWERPRWPILCDRRGIAWVVGVRVSEDHRAMPGAREVLRVEARRT